MPFKDARGDSAKNKAQEHGPPRRNRNSSAVLGNETVTWPLRPRVFGWKRTPSRKISELPSIFFVQPNSSALQTSQYSHCVHSVRNTVAGLFEVFPLRWQPHEPTPKWTTYSQPVKFNKCKRKIRVSGDWGVLEFLCPVAGLSCTLLHPV